MRTFFKKANRMQFSIPLTLGVLGLVPAFGAENGIALRAEHLTVLPSSGPVTHVLIRNRGETPFAGQVRFTPAGSRAWCSVSPAEREVTLGAGETKRVPFVIERGREMRSNRYLVDVTAVGGGREASRSHAISTTSAPYFKPQIDGDPREWDDAIPVTFETGGRKTVVRTYWNRRAFCLLVEVTEDNLIGYRTKPAGASFDALQFALARRTAQTPAAASGKAARHEFLVTSSSSLWRGARCFRLLRPGDPLAVAGEQRRLASRETRGVQAVVSRREKTTCYECAIPFSLLSGIRGGEGRELCFSLLVHDPDGTGVRDWGEFMGLWPEQRSPLAWCSWNGVAWSEYVPYDGKIEWGLCSSKK